ncbi:mammalian cell entry protein [Rhodococcus sp. BE178]|uniref:mammalian cell entry protein n=1 Tax=Rhodococcus sp. BE178 TaxID=2817737 RepID=UPI003D1B3B9A
MPPIRRNPKVSPSAARRPKVAGSSAPRPASPAAPIEDAVKEPDASVLLVKEPAEPALEESAVEAPAPASSASSGPAGSEPEEDGPEPETGGASDAGGRRWTDRLRWRSVVIMGVAAAVLAAFAGVAAMMTRDGGTSNRAFLDVGATSEVAAAAEKALTAVTVYSADSIDQFPDTARAVMTDGMKAEFDRTIGTTIDIVKQARSDTAAQVTNVGVMLLDENRAEVLANLIVSVENNGVAAGSTSGPVILRMEKVDGQWLLSGVENS